MITAIDSNVLLDVILLPQQKFYEASADALESAAALGPLIICDVVYAEICGHFATQPECDFFLEGNEIRVESLKRAALFLASRAFRAYRRQGGRRTHALPNFFIGAHAQLQATRLLSRDRGLYRKYFPALKLLDPARSGWSK
ncbi:MAG TPA: type II toxin-antitoxin system VapC family toxin [Bryobacteraceae bacterium]|nr:type II toxin-antitoxin system VapC family toxin [Bryobacteraceae bacterium]